MAEALEAPLPPVLDRLAKQVLHEACDRGFTLATAESCTGGLLASLLTDVPGLSHAFERGFVVYTNAAKHEMTGVPDEIIDTDGPVSEAAAVALAQGALAQSRADVAVSVTGYTEGPPEEAGLVHFACARRGRPARHRVERFGDVGRAAVRLAALQTALEMLRDQMIEAPISEAPAAGRRSSEE